MVFPFVGIPLIGGKMLWQNMSSLSHGPGDGIMISINYHGRITRKELRDLIRGRISEGDIPFLKHESGYFWTIDLDIAKSFFQDEKLAGCQWLTGKITFDQELEIIQEGDNLRTRFSIHFMKEEIADLTAQKIFLSHKSADKPLVRDIARLLTSLGFDPWLDEDAMNAGTNLERAILAGMEASCAAVFFVTSDYKDQNYLATEIDYAIQQKREKGDQFAIVTIVLSGADGNKGDVPKMLKSFVWKEPQNGIQAVNEIVKSLPIRLSGTVWK